MMKRWPVYLMVPLMALAGCSDVSHIQRNDPTKPFQDNRIENKNNASVIGIGEPISTRQMKANATFTAKGMFDIDQIMSKMAGTYNVAVRWGNGVRKGKRKDVVINNLGFNEARAYVEDVFDVQIIREGDRRLLILPSASEPRLKSFKPGDNISLGEVLRGLAAQCGYNLVISENREKIASTTVSTNMQDVTCFDAFEALLNPHNMSLVAHGDYYTIGGLPQRQWNVPLMEPIRAEEMEVSYNSDFSSNSSEGGGGTQNAGGTSKVNVKTERNLWVELERDLNALIENNCESNDTNTGKSNVGNSTNPMNGPSLLPPPTLSPIPQNQSVPAPSPSSGSSGGGKNEGCGYVKVNTTVGVVQMKASISVLNEADDIINRVQDIANRRLLLEARILAVSKENSFEQGANLAFQKGDLSFGAGGKFLSESTTAAGALGNLISSANAGGFIASQKYSLDAIVRLLEAYTTTYQLMKPRLELMDRQRATLVDGTNQRYFIQNIETETLDNGNTLRNVTNDERFQFEGIQFSVAAQISDDEEPHTVSVQIPITSIVGSEPMYQENDGEGTTVNIPEASTRLIDQKVRIRDGEIKVIGGLTKTIARDKNSGQPILREVPVMGKLLGDENITYEEVEFVVLLQVKRLF